MIQILLTKNKYYKKKHLFIIQLIISIIILFVIIYFICNYFYKIKKQEEISKQLTSNYNLSLLYADIESTNTDQDELLENTDGSNLFGTIEIPKIQINYPIFPELNEESLKIAPCKFYGDNLNKNGNICIAGHNYDNGKFFSNIVLLDIDDIIYIYSNNNKYTYNVISKYEVNANDLTPIFEYDSNKKYLTLVTCNNLNGNRIIIKALQV